MEEFDFIKSITPTYYKQASVIKGIGDDAAILRFPYEDLITAVDTMVENVHFSTKTTEPFHVGYRSLAANISDIAAMGGKPTAYLVSIVIPKGWNSDALKEVYQGMSQLADSYHMDLIGGDTVSGEQLTISITVFGSVPRTKIRYRSTAKEGDIVFVTGTLGDSACGLHVLLNEPTSSHNEYQRVIHRHQQPYPRVHFMTACQQIERITLNDISDGIANESNEIAEASNQTLLLDYAKIPYSEQLKHFSNEKQMKWKLSGGEDFELMGTIAQKDWQLLNEIAIHTQTSLTSIGEVVHNSEENGNVFLKKDGAYRLLNKSGYTHLRR